jgi:hypothetical protein
MKTIKGLTNYCLLKKKQKLKNDLMILEQIKRESEVLINAEIPLDECDWKAYNGCITDIAMTSIEINKIDNDSVSIKKSILQSYLQAYLAEPILSKDEKEKMQMFCMFLEDKERPPDKSLINDITLILLKYEKNYTPNYLFLLQIIAYIIDKVNDLFFADSNPYLSNILGG